MFDFLYANKPVEAEELRGLIVRSICQSSLEDDEGQGAIARGLVSAYSTASEAEEEDDDKPVTFLDGKESEALFSSVAIAAYAKRFGIDPAKIDPDNSAISPPAAFYSNGYTASIWPKAIVLDAARAVGAYAAGQEKAFRSFVAEENARLTAGTPVDPA